jgi:hypothetical protein
LQLACLSIMQQETGNVNTKIFVSFYAIFRAGPA